MLKFTSATLLKFVSTGPGQSTEILTLLLCIARGDGVGVDDAFDSAIDVCTATVNSMGQKHKTTAPLFKKLGFLIGGVISVIML